MRYRITGLLFLGVLAAIVGPLLFDGEGLPSPPAVELTGEPILTQAEIQAREEALLPTAPPPAPPLEGLDELEAASAVLRDAVDDLQFDQRQPAQRPAEPELAPLADDTRVFAVQVGSFAEAGNAEQLKARLRNAGYEAFLSTAGVAGRELTRVVVGPYLSRAQADTDRADITRRFDLDAKLMGMLL